MMEVVKIPAERVAALTGQNGATRKMIESECRVALRVEAEGEVEVEGESADVYFAKDVVKAIGRGFAPREAMRIIRDNCQFYLVNLKEHFKNENALTRVKGRVIGENGKVKAEIESAAECAISVYGNTIGIIAKMDTMEYAKEAISMILSGAPHSTVYTYLAKIRRRIVGERLTGKQL